MSAPGIAPPESEFCFRGRPLARCRTFALVELGYSAALVGSRQTVESAVVSQRFAERALPSYLALDVGGMRNRDSTHALGATLHLGAAGGGVRAGVKARRRTWYAGGGTLDLAAGPLAAHLRGARVNSPRVWGVGGTAEAALGWRDLAAVTVSADLVGAAGRPRGAVYAGVRLGSYPAVVATGLLAAGVAVLAHGLQD